MTVQNEKAEEKQEEKRQEKSWDGKDWRRDTLGSTIWALILIWAGVVFLAQSLNLSFFDWLNWANVWSVIMLGAALLLGLEIAVRLMVPSYAAPLGGRIILAIILGTIGLTNLVDVSLWPFVLIAIGLYILVKGFTGGSR